MRSVLGTDSFILGSIIIYLFFNIELLISVNNVLRIFVNG